MEFIVVNDYEEMSEVGAKLAKEVIDHKSDASLVLAVGNTPLGMYQEMTNMRVQGTINTSLLRIFQLDGYLGLSARDPRSLEGWLRRSVIEPWEIAESQLVTLPEDGINPAEVCRSYDAQVLEAGGFDLAVLGLGPNGHLGFNEPPSNPNSPTRIVELTAESIRSNARYWGGEEQVPRTSITAGMNILLAARKIILLVSGENKRDILEKTLIGPICDEVPSSYLKLNPNTTIIADKAACSDAGSVRIIDQI